MNRQKLMFSVILASLLFSACAHDYIRWEPSVYQKNLKDKGKKGISLILLKNKENDLNYGVFLIDHAKPVVLVKLGDIFEKSSKIVYANEDIYNLNIFKNKYKYLDNYDLSKIYRINTDSKEFKYLNKKMGPFALNRAMAIKACDQDNNEKRERVAQENEVKLRYMYGQEFDLINNSNVKNRSSKIGLALSGGGIRSASFSIGVLQGLHEIGVLEKIGYLSTVSGGGYAASWYMTHDDDNSLFHPGSRHLYHISQYGHYLTSSHYSKSTAVMVGRILQHNLYFPSHILGNYIFNYNLNIGLNRYYYRDGIARAFQYEEPLPADGNVIIKTKDESIKEYSPSKKNKPFWIINMQLSLKDDTSYFKNRTGDAFELTPLRAGAASVGYVDVEKMEKLNLENFWISPYYAAAISGAAIDSHSLAAWTGLLEPLNYNLGYYINGWNSGYTKEDGFWCVFWKNFKFSLPVPAFVPLTCLGKHRTLDSKRYYLSDGGHFENLGVYALVKRGCRLIIISDAGMDPEVNEWDVYFNDKRAKTFSDLHNLETKLYSDFGARIKMRWEEFSVLNTSKSGKSTVFIGTIENLPIWKSKKKKVNYETITIIYIKAAYNFNFEGLGVNFIDNEKAINADFPHESTGNQFFSERKILAYQALAREMVVKNSNKIKIEFSKYHQE